MWVGATVGGLVHILLYTLATYLIFDWACAVANLLLLVLQTVSGIVIGNILYSAVKNKI